MGTTERVAARIKVLDQEIPILEAQLTKLKEELESASRFLPFAKNVDIDESLDARVETSTTAKRPFRPRSPDTQAARALSIIRAHPQGITIHDMILESGIFGNPFKMNSISSQLSQLVKRDVIKKVGDRYVAHLA